MILFFVLLIETRIDFLRQIQVSQPADTTFIIDPEIFGVGGGF